MRNIRAPRERARLKFIEQCLIENNRVRRSDIMEEFGLSNRQAAVYVSKYMKLARSNLAYDVLIGAYVRGAEFKPVFD